MQHALLLRAFFNRFQVFITLPRVIGEKVVGKLFSPFREGERSGHAGLTMVFQNGLCFTFNES